MPCEMAFQCPVPWLRRRHQTVGSYPDMSSMLSSETLFLRKLRITAILLEARLPAIVGRLFAMPMTSCLANPHREGAGKAC